VLRAKDVLPLQKDKRLMQVEADMMKYRGYPEEGNMWRFNKSNLLMSNGNVHTRRRKSGVDAFSRRMIALLRDYIRTEARILAQALPRGVDFDLVEALPSPLTGRVIANTVGLDPDNWREFAELAYEITQGMAPPFPEARWPRIEEAAGRFVRYVEEAVLDRRAHPRDDFLSAYVQAADAAGEMNAEEVLMVLVSIVLAGSDTTRSGITVTIGQLLEERGRWECVLADRSLIPNAITESIRLDPPVGGSPRMTAEPLEIDGITIPPGMPVDLLTISAMRDPDMYQGPDTFDLHRTDGPRYHMVFGGGVHRCLGEQLALAEMEEALGAVLDLAPTMRIIGDRVPLKGFTAVREATTLMVHID
jgi:cytochrome P450